MSSPPSPHGPGWRSQALLALVLAAAGWFVYSPALHRVFAADQISYFAELEGKTSLSAGLQHLDYAVSRRYWKGDDALFRPLVFAWLAAGNTMFSYHHAWWNGANLLFHVLVALLLYRLLYAIQPSPFAAGAALLFLVMKPPLELVLWNHLGGYLLAWLFFLAALRAFHAMTQRDRAPRYAELVYAGAFAAAALSHESMVPACLAAGILAAASQLRARRRLGWRRLTVLAAPLVLFAILYAMHVPRVERFGYVDRPDAGGMFGVRAVLQVIPRIAYAFEGWGAETIQPTALRFSSAAFHRLEKVFTFDWRSEAQVWNLLIVLVLLRSAIRAISWDRVRERAELLALLGVSTGAYTAVICLGRTEGEVLAITYYAYFFCLCSVAVIYGLLDLDGIRGWRLRAAWIAVAALAVLHGVETRAAAAAVGRSNDAPSRYFTAIGRFVDAHANEPDFSFSVEGAPAEVDPEFPLQEGYPDQGAPIVKHRVSELIFMPYYDAVHPRYRLDAGGNVVSTPAAESR